MEGLGDSRTINGMASNDSEQTVTVGYEAPQFVLHPHWQEAI
jgi:hypothetical protein